MLYKDRLEDALKYSLITATPQKLVGSRKSIVIIIDSSLVTPLALIVLTTTVKEDIIQQPYKQLTKDLIPSLQRQIDRMLKEHLRQPRNSEIFESKEQYYKRL